MSLLTLLPACTGVIPDPGPPTPGQASGNLLQSNTTVTIASDARFPGLCVSQTGELMVAWRSSANHHPDAAAVIKARWSTDGGKTWGTEATVYDPTPDPRDVTLSRLADGRIALTAFHYVDANNYQTHVAFSSDHGRTFGAPVAITSTTASRVNACSGPVVEAANGDLLLAIYGDASSSDMQSAIVVKSTNGGTTWTEVAVIASGPGSAGDAYGPESTGGFYEPFLHRLNDDTILAAVRHDREKVWFAHSTDNGATWSTITKSSMSRGGRPAICQVAETGGLVLSDRRDTTVRYTTSWDEGATWPNADVIILPSEFRGAYAQMAEYAPGVLGHAWSMEDDLGGATLRFTALYDSNLADPLA